MQITLGAGSTNRERGDKPVNSHLGNISGVEQLVDSTHRQFSSLRKSGWGATAQRPGGWSEISRKAGRASRLSSTRDGQGWCRKYALWCAACEPASTPSYDTTCSSFRISFSGSHVDSFWSRSLTSVRWPTVLLQPHRSSHLAQLTDD